MNKEKCKFALLTSTLLLQNSKVAYLFCSPSVGIILLKLCWDEKHLGCGNHFATRRDIALKTDLTEMLTREINGRHFKLEKMTRHTLQGDVLAFLPEA